MELSTSLEKEASTELPWRVTGITPPATPPPTLRSSLEPWYGRRQGRRLIQRKNMFCSTWVPTFYNLGYYFLLSFYISQWKITFKAPLMINQCVANTDSVSSFYIIHSYLVTRSEVDGEEVPEEEPRHVVQDQAVQRQVERRYSCLLLLERRSMRGTPHFKEMHTFYSL